MEPAILIFIVTIVIILLVQFLVYRYRAEILDKTKGTWFGDQFQKFVDFFDKSVPASSDTPDAVDSTDNSSDTQNSKKTTKKPKPTTEGASKDVVPQSTKAEKVDSSAPYTGSGNVPGNWSVEFGNDQKDVPTPEFQFTDGFCPVIKKKDGNGYILILSEARSYMTTGDSPWFEDAKGWKTVVGNSPCQTGKWPNLEDGTFFSGGVWIMFAHRQPDNPNRIICLTHNEGRNCGTQKGVGGIPVLKTISVLYSDDECQTFTRPKRVISFGEFNNGKAYQWGDPASVGDFSASYDTKNNCYLCIFHSSKGIGLARSTKPDASQWELWNGGWKGDPGIGGPNYKALNLPSGGNPSLNWSSFYNCWIVTYLPWTRKNIVVALSGDCINWVVKTYNPPGINLNGNVWLYNQFAGDQGTDVVGEKAKMYYCQTTNGRRMVVRSVTFKK